MKDLIPVTFRDVLVLIYGLIIGWYVTSDSGRQLIKLTNMFIYGPFLIYLGLTFKDKLTRSVLLSMGATIIAYSLKKYMDTAALRKR